MHAYASRICHETSRGFSASVSLLLLRQTMMTFDCNKIYWELSWAELSWRTTVANLWMAGSVQPPSVQRPARFELSRARPSGRSCHWRGVDFISRLLGVGYYWATHATFWLSALETGTDWRNYDVTVFHCESSCFVDVLRIILFPNVIVSIAAAVVVNWFRELRRLGRSIG